MGRTVAFICNICGEHNRVENFATEPASCSCGSNVRIRLLIHLLSLELFGESLVLSEFPRIRSIRGLGMSDQEHYAVRLAEKFDYTNTYYDREPRLDFTGRHPELYNSYDFILSGDVIEHIAPPVERALEEACRLLKPSGFLDLTVFCNPADQMREHFPQLHEYRVVPLGDAPVLLNRRADGTLETLSGNLIFHGGSGETLEMREFGISELKAKLLGCGFSEVSFFNEDVPRIGILFDHDVSQPLIARKQPFLMNTAARRELIDRWHVAQGDAVDARERADRLAAEISMASQSLWLRLGRKIGLGPKFT